MRIIKRVLKLVGWFLLITTLLITLITILFVTMSAQFGGKPSKEEIAEYETLQNYKDGVFTNLKSTTMDMNFSKGLKIMGQFIRGVSNGKPDFKIPVLRADSTEIAENKSQTQLIWFGHSAFLLQMAGQTILIDPMLGKVPAPHPWLGNKRFSEELPLSIEEIPHVNAIIISHDHYDHLDYESIQKLKGKTDHFYVPLGVGAHFREWGVPAEKIHELNWWDEINHENLTLGFAPSRHFSGRGFKRNETLWGSWVIMSESERIYFSGDGGYGDHFKAIGEKYGPFDFAMLECGQYNENWAQIHMMPEETAQAALDVKAKLMMPIHWGAFQLALHSWTDPIERVSKKAAELTVPLIAPKIGQPIFIDGRLFEQEKWWQR